MKGTTIFKSLFNQAESPTKPGAVKSLSERSSWLSMLIKMGLYAGSEELGLMPDVMLGGVPLYVVQRYESAKSNKELRFRGSGGVMLAFQKPDGNTLSITVRLGGPLGLVWMSMLEALYTYGTERSGKAQVKDLGLIKVGRPAEIITSSGSVMNIFATQPSVIDSMGTSKPITESMLDITNGGNGVEAPADSTRWDSTYQPSGQGMTRYYKKDMEQLALHRTFQVITKHEVMRRMYIETMITVKDNSMGLDEYEVHLLLRHYTVPLIRLFKGRIASTEAVKLGKTERAQLEKFRAANVRAFEKSVEEESEDLAQLFERNAKKADYKLRSNTRMFIPKTGNNERKFYTILDAVQVEGDDDYRMFKLNLAWRAYWTTRELGWGKYTGLKLGNDPLVGRVMRALNLVNLANSRVSVGDGKATYIPPPIEDTNPTGENRGPVSLSLGSRTVHRNDTEALMDGDLVGETVELEVETTPEKFISTTTSGDETEIDDVFVVLPRKKQDDFEDVVAFGSSVYKLEGYFALDGKLLFQTPANIEFKMKFDSSTLSQTEYQTLVCTLDGVTSYLQPGLTYFMGTGDRLEWRTAPDGSYYANKRISDEAYLYIHSLVKMGERMHVTAFYITPRNGT